MDPIITKIIEQLNSSVFVLLLVLAAVGYMLMKIGEWKEKFSHHHNRIDNLETLSDKVLVISTKVDLIYQHVNPNSMVRANSPMSLTPTGEETARTINAEDLLTRYYSRLKHEVDDRNPQNAYDIQTESMLVAKNKLKRMMTANEINTIKNAAYQKGVIAEDIL